VVASQPPASYRWRVRAINDDGARTAWSTPASFSIVVGDNTPPGAVTGFGPAPGDGKINLVWNDPGDDDLAGIRLSWTPGNGRGQPRTIAPGVETATISDLNNLHFLRSCGRRFREPFGTRNHHRQAGRYPGHYDCGRYSPRHSVLGDGFHNRTDGFRRCQRWDTPVHFFLVCRWYSRRFRNRGGRNNGAQSQRKRGRSLQRQRDRIRRIPVSTRHQRSSR
jgi:hypothetical protein